MSIFGKFFAEFTPGDWDFSWRRIRERYNSTPVGARTYVASVTTGDGPVDLIGLLGLLNTRCAAAVASMESTGSYQSLGVFDSDLYPTDFTLTWVEGPSTTAATTATTSQHSTVALGFGGYRNYVPSGNFDEPYKLDQIVWSTTDDDLLTVLGFDQTETVVSDHIIIANNRPRYVWFPGVDSYGSDSGAGITSDTGWLPVDAQSRIVSGAGNVRVTGPSRMQYRRVLRFEALKRAEMLEARHNGPIALLDAWATLALRWYPDRDKGVVGAVGTQGDPGPPSYHVDSDCDYWAVRLLKQPRITQAKDPDWFAITLELNGEPA